MSSSVPLYICQSSFSRKKKKKLEYIVKENNQSSIYVCSVITHTHTLLLVYPGVPDTLKHTDYTYRHAAVRTL